MKFPFAETVFPPRVAVSVPKAKVCLSSSTAMFSEAPAMPQSIPVPGASTS